MLDLRGNDKSRLFRRKLEFVKKGQNSNENNRELNVGERAFSYPAHVFRWWLFALAFLVISWWNFDYSSSGIFLMLVFYLCRNHPAVGAVFYLLFTVPPAFHVHPDDFLNLTLGGLSLNWTFAMAFAALFIFPRTHTNLKVPRWLFYAFYPVHLLMIGLVRLVLKV